MRTNTPPATIQEKTKAHVAERGLRRVASTCGVHTSTVRRVLDGRPVSPASLAALSRLSPKVRDGSEFQHVHSFAVRAPRRQRNSFGWPLSRILAARNNQILGKFDQPVRMAEAMQSDDAIYVARGHRVDPLSCLEGRLIAAPGLRGEAVGNRARAAVVTPRTTLRSIDATVVEHGIAVGINRWETNGTGTLVSVTLEEWPLEFVRYNDTLQSLETRTLDGVTVPIRHGDGIWTVFCAATDQPWRKEACLLPASVVWAAHSEAVLSWLSGARAHGLAQLLGELPESIPISEDGGATLTAEGQAFYQLLLALASGEANVGLKPPGSEIDFIANDSPAHEIFDALVTNRERAAARIYTGTDAYLGSSSSAPGVDIAELFKVATAKTQKDVDVLTRGVNTGVLAPWCALNEGDSRLAPRLEYQLADPDAERRRLERANNWARFETQIKGMRAQKLDVTQETIDRLAADFGISPVPKLAAADVQTSSLILAPTDVAKIVRVREARASQGLPAFGDERDELTLGELDAYIAAKNAPVAPAAPARDGNTP